MTFAKQIDGVPLELVRQGWRRAPTVEDDQDWRDKSSVNHWAYESCWDNGSHFWIAQPVILVKGCRVYAHAGWGEGLSPTPEMVKVWKWWWYLPAMGSFLRAVEVLETPEGLQFQCADMPVKPITQARGEWRGPVLPPMEVK